MLRTNHLAEKMLSKEVNKSRMRILSLSNSCIVISLILIYLATLTADYYWDGITFALQIEKVVKRERGAFLLFHQNHLLYNALGYVPYYLVHALGLPMDRKAIP